MTYVVYVIFGRFSDHDEDIERGDQEDKEEEVEVTCIDEDEYLFASESTDKTDAELLE